MVSLASMVLSGLEIGCSCPPSRSILMKTLQIFRERKMVEVLGTSHFQRESFPPEIDVYKVPHSRFSWKSQWGGGQIKDLCLFKLKCFFSSQDERTCNFCWTDSATDWGELTKKRFPWCTTIAQCSMKYSTTTCTLQKKILAAMNPEKGLWMITIDTEKGFACVLASADNSFQ